MIIHPCILNNIRDDINNQYNNKEQNAAIASISSKIHKGRQITKPLPIDLPGNQKSDFFAMSHFSSTLVKKSIELGPI